LRPISRGSSRRRWHFSVTVIGWSIDPRDWPAPTARLRATAPNRIVKAGLILATILVLAALGLDFLAPLFLTLDRRIPMSKLLACAAFTFAIVTSSVAVAVKRRSLGRNNMDCVTCPSIVKGSLEAVPGVAKVGVSFKDKRQPSSMTTPRLM